MCIPEFNTWVLESNKYCCINCISIHVITVTSDGRILEKLHYTVYKVLLTKNGLRQALHVGFQIPSKTIFWFYAQRSWKGSVTIFWFCENSWNPFLILLTLSLLLANGPQPPTFLNNYQLKDLRWLWFLIKTWMLSKIHSSVSHSKLHRHVAKKSFYLSEELVKTTVPAFIRYLR